MDTSDLEKARAYFEKRVKETDRSKCWLWRGTVATKSRAGRPDAHTPLSRVGGENVSARTVSWWLDGGLISDGPFRPTCKNDLCVNPDHLEPCNRSHKGSDNDFVQRLEYGFYLNSLSEDDDGD